MTAIIVKTIYLWLDDHHDDNMCQMTIQKNHLPMAKLPSKRLYMLPLKKTFTYGQTTVKETIYASLKKNIYLWLNYRQRDYICFP